MPPGLLLWRHFLHGVTVYNNRAHDNVQFCGEFVAAVPQMILARRQFLEEALQQACADLAARRNGVVEQTLEKGQLLEEKLRELLQRWTRNVLPFKVETVG